MGRSDRTRARSASYVRDDATVGVRRRSVVARWAMSTSTRRTELSEPHEEHKVEGRERVLELVAVLLLSLTTLLTAWSGYQAALWSGEQSKRYATASANRARAQQQSTLAGQLRIDDLLLLQQLARMPTTPATRRLAEIYRRRFRPEFRPAFTAWLRADPSRPHAIPTPVHAAVQLAADAREGARPQGRRLLRAGQRRRRATTTTTSWRRCSSPRCSSSRASRCGWTWRPLRIVVLGLAAAMSIGGGIFIASLPVA